VQEHISVKEIERYQKRELSPRELLALDDHLAQCDDCRAQISGTAALRSSSIEFIPALENETFEHPEYEQLAAYVDGQLNSVERNIIESHLACCGECSKELSDFESIKAQVASFSQVTTSKPIVETSGQRRASLLEKFAGFWRVPSFRIPLQAALAVGAVALIVWAITLPLRKDIASLRTQLADAERRNEELQRDFEISKADADSLQAQIAQLQSTNPTQPEGRVLALNDALIKIDSQGNIDGLTTLSAALQQNIRSAIDTGQAKIPQSISSLISKAGVLMGGGNEGIAFALESPIGTAVLSTRPTFRWQPLAAATGYTVTVLDMDFNLISKSPVLSSTSWTAVEPLERGRTYTWIVTAIKEGKEVKSPVAPAPEARFKILEKETATEVLKTRQDYRDSHLISGLVCAQAGLLDEAEREFDLLVRENPKSPVANKLLRSVKSLRSH
jgi:anti-sigma factor RsiW